MKKTKSLMLEKTAGRGANGKERRQRYKIADESSTNSSVGRGLLQTNDRGPRCSVDGGKVVDADVAE
ncbi:hypothetical protein EV1_015732 [Malus domestica]